MRNRKVLTLIYLLLISAGCFGLLQTQYVQLKAKLAQYLIAQSWISYQQPANATQHAAPAWPWADFTVLARLQWQDEEVYVLDRASGQALAFGPGHLQQSAALGTAGRAMVAGHNDSHFAFLQHMQRGDTLLLETAHARQKSYKISSIDVVDSRTSRLQHSSDDELVLVTCYPFDGLLPEPPLRYVVTAQLETAPHAPISF